MKNNFFKVTPKEWKRMKNNFFKVTPKEWKQLQKVCFGLSASAAAAWGSMIALGVDVEGWGKAVAGFVGAMVFIATFAQNKGEK